MKLWDKGLQTSQEVLAFTCGRDRTIDNRLALFDILGSMAHATMLGEKIVALGGHPSVAMDEVEEPGEQPLLQMLEEDIAVEEKHIEMYERHLNQFQKDIVLKLMYEQIILEEVTHLEQLQLYVRHNDFN